MTWGNTGLSFKQHIKNKCGIAIANIHRIRKLARYLNIDSAKTLASATVLSHLDCGNSMFTALPANNIRPMQLVQIIMQQRLLLKGESLIVLLTP